MDQQTYENKGIDGSFVQGNQVTHQNPSGNSSNSDNGVPETMMTSNSKDIVSDNGESGVLDVNFNELGPVVNQENSDGDGMVVSHQNPSGNSSNSDNGVPETKMTSNSKETHSESGETGVLDSNLNELGSVVNQETTDGKGMMVSLNEGTSGNSSKLIDVAMFESIVVINSRENMNVAGENEDLESSGRAANHGTHGERRNDEALDQVREESSGDSSCLVYGSVLQTVIVINSDDNAGISRGNQGLEKNGNGLGSSKVTEDTPKTKVPQGEEPLSVIDPECGGGGDFTENSDGERVCRICHLSSEGELETTVATTASAVTSMDLIQLGCGCKDELGIAHAFCAEAWFKLKGNRICEICGETAKGIKVVVDNRLREECNVRRFIGSHSTLSDRNGGCWRLQPFCNFLMACLIIAFVLPWFFRVNMF